MFAYERQRIRSVQASPSRARLNAARALETVVGALRTDGKARAMLAAMGSMARPGGAHGAGMKGGSSTCPLLTALRPGTVIG